MKTIPTIIAATLLIVSISASADSYFERSVTETQTTQVAPTKEAAYKLGMEKLTRLQAASPRQLDLDINTPLGDIKVETLHLKGTPSVTVQEIMSADGQTGYTAQVKFGLGYELSDSDA